MSRLIDADKLLENKFKNDISWNAFEKLIKRQPTVDAVKVVHGHWGKTLIPILLRDNTTRTYFFKCSKCSFTSWNRDNYCQQCGAKMDEVTE